MFKKLYIHSRFFQLLIVIGGLFFVSFFIKWLYSIASILLSVFILLLLIDIVVLFSMKHGIKARRQLPEKLSNGDDNPINILIKNNYRVPVQIKIIDEIPFQYQKRDFLIQAKIQKQKKARFTYTLRPIKRGEYLFGKMNVYVLSSLKLAVRRFVFSENALVVAYPSFIQMKRYDMMAFSNHLFDFGLKKIRRIGHTMEFEQIKEYVQGDDIRTINWKATSKKSQLMVNQYQEEKSQSVYMIIDKGRSMQMPFNGLCLLDYAVNATLALSNIVLKKKDKAGMFTFSKKTENRTIATRKPGQLQEIMEALYRIDTDFMESDFSRLYVDIKQFVKQRSLILLYTNYETMDALRRQLPYLKAIAKNHLLIVIFFENTELNQLIEKPSRKVIDVYDKAIAEKFMFEKRLIANELYRHGIQSLLTKPEKLTLESINRYLEIKARGMI